MAKTPSATLEHLPVASTLQSTGWLRPTEQARICADLKRRLQHGEFRPAGRLPSIRELARAYGSTTGTVQLALNRLRHERLLTAHHGRGVFVADPAQSTRQVLWLSHTEGDEWADYLRAFSNVFGRCPRTRLLVESVPFRSEPAHAAFQEKVKRILAEGVDLVLFNGLVDLGLGFLKEFERRVPLICFYVRHGAPQWNCGSVVTDHHHGGYAGIKHLIEVGCRHIALLVHTTERGMQGDMLHEFLDGCEAARQESTHPVQFEWFRATGFDPQERTEERFRQLLRERPQLDGVFGFADYVTAPLIPILREQGRRVPGDVAVLGYYDTHWTRTTNPPLSSLSTQPEEIAAAVMAMIENNHLQAQRVIKPRLIVRASSQR